MANESQLNTLNIDPGGKGGYAVCYGGLKEITLHNLDTVSDFLEHILELEEISNGFLQAVLEDVPPYAGKNIPSYTSFKLGKNCGQIEGILRARQIPIHLISPRKWQAGFSGLKGLSGTARKRALKDHAHRLYPTLKPTLRTADALLMAHYFFTHKP